MHRRQLATIPGPVLRLIHYLCSLFSASFWALEMVIQYPIYGWAFTHSRNLWFLNFYQKKMRVPSPSQECRVRRKVSPSWRFVGHWLWVGCWGKQCAFHDEKDAAPKLCYRKCLQDRQLEWSDLPLIWVHPRCIINVMCCAFLRTLGHRCRCYLFSVRKTNESQVMCPRSITRPGF